MCYNQGPDSVTPLGYWCLMLQLRHLSKAADIAAIIHSSFHSTLVSCGLRWYGASIKMELKKSPSGSVCSFELHHMKLTSCCLDSWCPTEVRFPCSEA